MNNPQVNSTSSHDPVGTCILNIEIILVLNQFEESIYLFKNNWNQYWKYILKLNPEKASIFGNITTQVLKESFDAFNLALKNIWNLEMLEKHCFSLHLTNNVNNELTLSRCMVLVQNLFCSLYIWYETLWILFTY